ncbi:MAG: mechanosensitive ion channel family protein [Acidimicrobiales bacterium]
MLAVTLSDDARHVVGIAIRIALILAIAGILRFLIHRAIGRTTSQMKSRLQAGTFVSTIAGGLSSSSDGSHRVEARANTIEAMGRSLTTWIVFVMAALLVLGELRIDLAPLLAGAGVAGIAIGFGAQSLVRDVLAGFFVLVEDQYGVGDIIDAGPASGTVERISLRSTQLRDLAGTVWHIPNGTIQRVGNKSQNWARAIVEVTVSHSADVRQARALMAHVAATMATEDDWAPAMRVGGVADDQGISALTPTGVTLRLVVDTEPKSQWSVERELRLRIKEAFDEAGVPFEVHQPPRPMP